MNTRRYWLVALLLAAAVTLLATTVPWPSAASEGQNAEPKMGVAGQRFDFFATGFDDGEPVGFWAVRPDGTTVEDGAGEVIANEYGRADWFWIAPLDAMPGAWILVAEGVDSGTLRTLRIEITSSVGSQPAQPPVPLAPGTFIPPGFSLNPQEATVNAGASITFVGTGFFEGERVASWATGPDAAVIGGPAVWAGGRQGRAEVTIDIPRRALGGAWAVTLKGDESLTPVTVVFYVNERVPPPTQNQAAVTPDSAPAGSVFTFVATGFDDQELVGYWLTDPDGRIYTGEGAVDDDAGDTTVSASEVGVVRVSWRVPGYGPPGIWVITFQGVDSGIARGIPFEVR